MNDIYGRIKRRTAKAVLFHAVDMWNGVQQALVGDHWLPLSQVRVREREVGNVDAVLVPTWLIQARQNKEQ